MCHGEKSFEVLNECLHEKGIYFACRNCNLEFWSHANLKYHIDVFMRREIIVPVEIVIRFEEIKSLIFTG